MIFELFTEEDESLFGHRDTIPLFELLLQHSHGVRRLDEDGKRFASYVLQGGADIRHQTSAAAIRNH